MEGQLWVEPVGNLIIARIRGEPSEELLRFSGTERPVPSIAAYLRNVQAEADARGYSFDRGRLARAGEVEPITVSRGQLDFEWEHLTAKVRVRDPAWYKALAKIAKPEAHPMFRIVRGGVAGWERGTVESRPANPGR